MILYERSTCWKCVEVRQVLDRLQATYTVVDVAGRSDLGDRLEAWTGMRLIPVLVDGDLVVWDRRRIIRYLEERHGGGAPGPPLPGWMGGERRLSPHEVPPEA
ncbi:MAG: glutathione S-transferase N-terminal domain-containing protein [Thermoleophilia bacterium]|jgi:glutathione S-transferase|nr:glutathione S-transferase N-terminal domain-containing protein [Thermoleophilia bacterium]